MAMVQLQSYAFTTVENPLSDGGNFTTTSGLSALRVPSSGVCEPSVTGVGCGAYWVGKAVQVGDSWPADHYTEMTVLTELGVNDIFVPSVRNSLVAQTYYQANVQSGATLGLYKTIAGMTTLLGTGTAVVISDGDVIRLSISGTSLVLTQNGTLIASVSDSSISSGVPGLELFNSTAIADTQISLWAAGANQAATPTFNPVAGSYATSQNVKISSSTPGGLIFYTTDGTTPTHSSSSIANGGTVTVSTPLTIKAFASVTNFADSATGSAAYSGSLTPGSNSSWLSVNNNNVLRGSRSH